MSKEKTPKKVAKKKAVKKAVTKKKTAAKPADVESPSVDEPKMVDKTAKTLETHDDHPPKPYLQVFIALAVLTIVEVAIGTIDTSPGKVAVLLLLAIAKAALVAAIFMHVRYEKNPASIIIVAFIVPLFGALLLSATIWSDY